MEQAISPQREVAEVNLSGSGSWESLRFRSKHAIALLGYLAVEHRPISRAFLARLLWPDDSPSKGLASLRRELYNLTQLLPDCWQLDRQTVAFAPSKYLQIDIYMLLELETQEYWIQAAALLRGEFLEALHLDDNLEFENWLTGERNRWQWRTERILTCVIEGQILRGRYRDGLQYCHRLLKLAPWKEDAYRQAMRLLTWTGQRGAALRQFESCKQMLKTELNVEPTLETTALFTQILAGELDLPPQRPAFLEEEPARHEASSPNLVAREREILQLHNALDKTIAGQGSVIFISGDAGRGKTVLMEAFARQAMEKHANLLVASGNCNAFSGIGDPYLPFRDIMAMLTGDVELKWDTGAISREHARRLWESFPLVAKALLDYAPDSIDILIQGNTLRERAEFFELTSHAPWVLKLNEFINHQQTLTKDLELSHLFQQVTNMAHAIAEKKPLLLILDDMQWVDDASVSLLFHLGRRISETQSKILILCAFRPEEVFSGRGDERHPLVKLLNEFKLVFENKWVNLAQVSLQEAQRFIDAIVDIHPNNLSKSFRSAMFQRTNGHPFFTVELMNAMRERGDLFKDPVGIWNEAVNLDWNLLPSKVEAVIEERIDRLDPPLQQIITIASIEGEIFTAEVLAEVQGEDVGSILRYLSIELEQKHRLVKEQEGIEINGRYFSRFKFNHILFQNYIYKHICEGERRLLHSKIANAIEKLYRTQVDIMSVQLAQHLQHAGDYNRAYKYYIKAGERAAGIYANHEAITHYTNAIDLLSRLPPNAASKVKPYQERGRIYEMIGKFEFALKDLETAVDLTRNNDDPVVKWRILIDLGKLWASRDLHLAKKYFETALDLARSLDQPKVLAESLNWVGNWYSNADKPQKAYQFHQEALLIVEKLNILQEMGNTLDLLGTSHLMGGNLKDCVYYYERAINVFREMDKQSRLVSSLTGCGAAYSMLAFLASVSTLSPSKAISYLKKALSIANEISSFSGEAWAYWALGMLQIVNGQFGQAIDVLELGLVFATENEHWEYILGFHNALGVLFIELFNPDLAVNHLEKAIAMAKELDSHTHLHLSCGTLAGAYFAQGDLNLAQNCLDNLISNQTPMDTLGKRYCWVRQAAIAHAQEDHESALDILNRLIETAPGIEPDDVITYIWMMKGEIFIKLRAFDEAFTYLQAAIANAQKMEERFLLWRVHAILGQLHLSINNPDAAQEAFHTSRSIIKNIAATILDPVIKEKYLQGANNILNYHKENIC